MDRAHNKHLLHYVGSLILVYTWRAHRQLEGLTEAHLLQLRLHGGDLGLVDRPDEQGDVGVGHVDGAVARQHRDERHAHDAHPADGLRTGCSAQYRAGLEHVVEGSRVALLRLEL